MTGFQRILTRHAHRRKRSPNPDSIGFPVPDNQGIALRQRVAPTGALLLFAGRSYIRPATETFEGALADV